MKDARKQFVRAIALTAGRILLVDATGAFEVLQVALNAGFPTESTATTAFEDKGVLKITPPTSSIIKTSQQDRTIALTENTAAAAAKSNGRFDDTATASCKPTPLAPQISSRSGASPQRTQAFNKDNVLRVRVAASGTLSAGAVANGGVIRPLRGAVTDGDQTFIVHAAGVEAVGPGLATYGWRTTDRM